MSNLYYYEVWARIEKCIREGNRDMIIVMNNKNAVPLGRLGGPTRAKKLTERQAA